MGSSNFSSKTVCPRCRALGRDNRGDNLAVYDDGHKFCFGCKYFVPAERSVANLWKKKVSSSVHPLPEDLTDAIDHKALQWLAKYDIESGELAKHSIRWSPKRQLLVFSFYNDSQEIVGWQARNFNENDKVKYLTFGRVDDFFPFTLTKANGNAIILVEDVISGIKIDRFYNALPLFGSTISHAKLTRLKYMADKLIFWLDFDKRSTSVFLAKVAQSLGFKTGIMVTDEDPKCYSNQELIDFLDPLVKGDI